MTCRCSPTTSHSGARNSTPEAVAEVTRPARRDAERGPDRAADAVGGDQVAGADPAAVAQCDLDAVGAALDAHDLDTAVKPRVRQRAQMLLEHRLEMVLRRARRSDRAEDGALRAGREAHLDGLPGRRRGEGGRRPGAPLHVHLARAHLPLEPPGAQQLHRRGADPGGPREIRQQVPPLQHERLDPRPGQRDRRRQPCRPGADHQHRDVLLPFHLGDLSSDSSSPEM